MRILVLIPTKPTLHSDLRSRSIELSARMQGANPEHQLTIIHDYRKIEGLPTDKTPWSRVTRARQALMHSVRLEDFDDVLWIDADVVEYPADMPTRLIYANPDGIAAPMVFIEGGGHWATRFYDFAAFLQKGKSHIEPMNRLLIKGRNLSHDAPYWDVEPQERIVEMDCVGTIVRVPVGILIGHRFFDHPAFTDWFALCKYAKQRGRTVIVDRDCVALHANLGSGKYPGEGWHG